jgi:tRNA(fMet)-specific endonuclease VapC
MSGSYLLDTNIIIAFYGQDPKVLKRIAQDKIYVPAVVVGELWFGAEKSSKKSSNQKQIEALIDQVIILPVTEETSKHYGIIKNQLKQKGNPIPENDIWIAATAREYNIILVTRDHHFSNIEEVKIETW